MPFVSKIEYLRTKTKFYHPIEEGSFFVTTTLDDDGWGKRTSMCKEFSAPRWSGEQAYSSEPRVILQTDGKAYTV